jgi:PAS domain S-box-containing protein
MSANSIDIVGMSVKDFMLGKSHTELFVHPEDREKLKEANYNSHLSQEIDITYRLLINDRVKWIREKSFPIFDRQGKVLKVSGICSDVSTLKSKEKELEIHSTLLAQKNKEVLDSINYANRIQSASLGLEEDRLALFPESFVIYKPKDIVSGDFYRFDQIRTNDHHVLKSIFVGDCTGHGVPGASLALLCNSILKQSLTEHNVNSPAESLSFASQQIKSLFHNSIDNKFYDGMDAGFCVIDPESLKLYFAGARFDCWIVRDGALEQIKGDRLHVGLHKEDLSFENKEFQLNKGDMLYMSSDGYSDQFGGPEEKKFMKKRLFDLLSEIASLQISEQESRLVEEHNEWIGDLEQTDDICLIGVRI